MPSEKQEWTMPKMDEATSSLDNETKKEITEAINEIGGEKTLIIVAHRVSTLEKYEKLFFIKNGKLADSGSFEELMARNVDFRSLTQLKAS